MSKFVYFAFAALALVSILNGYFYALFDDHGIWWLCHIVEHNIITYPGDSRFFGMHLFWGPIIFAKEMFSLSDVKVMLRLGSFWHSFAPVVFIIVNYFLLPKKQKDWIVFSLLSYLICKNFIPFSLWHTSHLAAVIFFAVFSAYLVSDIKEIPLFNFIILNTLSFLLIRSYEAAILFAPLIMCVIVYKCAREKNVPAANKILIYLNVLILLACVAYQAYVVLNPSHESGGIRDSLAASISDKTIQAVFLFTAAAIVFSLVNLKNKYAIAANIAFAALLCLFAAFLYKNLLFFYYFQQSIYESIYERSNGNRALNIIIPIVFSGLMFVLYMFRLNIRFYILQLTALVLLLSFAVNSAYLGASFDLTLRQRAYFLQNIRSKVVVSKEIAFYYVKPYQGLFLPALYQGNKAVKSVFVLSKDDEFYNCAQHNPAVSADTLPDLTMFGIYYCDELLDMLKSDPQDEKNHKRFPFDILN